VLRMLMVVTHALIVVRMRRREWLRQFRIRNKTSKTISKQGTSPGSGAGTKRQANYSEDDDYLIACAYMNASVDPIKGVGQRSETFWTRALEKYVILSEKYLSENGVEIPVRNKDSIEQ
jgi:hypothetical protein